MSAILSPCGRYRYRLDRTVGTTGPVYAFFGINPSTADATINDATVRKWIGFVRRWGGSRFIVGNVFAYRATDPKKIATWNVIADMEENGRQQQAIIAEADILVPCWGNITKIPNGHRTEPFALLGAMRFSGKPIKVFGFTKAGDPMHPLMLGYDTELQDWQP